MITKNKLTVIETYYGEVDECLEVYVAYQGKLLVGFGGVEGMTVCDLVSGFLVGYTIALGKKIPVEYGSIELEEPMTNLDYETIKKLYKPD